MSGSVWASAFLRPWIILLHPEPVDPADKNLPRHWQHYLALGSPFIAFLALYLTEEIGQPLEASMRLFRPTWASTGRRFSRPASSRWL